MDKKGVGVVVLLLFASVFGVFFVAPVFQHHVAVQENVETATATVESTEIDVKTDDEGDKSYSPVVTYTYTVGGETYENENVFPGGFQRWRGSRSWAEGIVAEYEVGGEATINYNPDDTERAYLRNDGPPSSVPGIVYAVVAFLGGAWLIRTGVRRWKQRTLIKDTPTENVRSMSVGASEIKGTAVTEDLEPLSAPFSDEDCVVAEYEVKEYDDDDDDSGGSWETVDEGVLHTPFYVNDGTGSVLVRPHDEAKYDLDPDDETTTYVDSSDRGPAPVQGFVESEGVGFPADVPGKENDRKYTQNLVKPDESVYVFGTARPRKNASVTETENANRLVVEKQEDGRLEETMFLISDDEEKDLVARRRWTLWHLPVGGLFVVASFAVLLILFGPGLGVTLPTHF